VWLVAESLGDRGLEMEASTDWKSLLGKGGAILLLLYLFVCSLGFLSDSFRLIAGRAAGNVSMNQVLILILSNHHKDKA